MPKLGTVYLVPGLCAVGWLVGLHQAMGNEAVAT